ncbi:MAG: SpoIID/LytB domain-containing protein [Smithella sp.]
MMNRESEIKVALLQNDHRSHIALNGKYFLQDGSEHEGDYVVFADHSQVVFQNSSNREIIRQKEILLQPARDSFFTVSNVKIGIDFHWQRTQEQSFRGSLFLSAVSDSSFNLINQIPLEDYLESVISSEMSAAAPLEFLKAQAITARSWLVSMLAKKNAQLPSTQVKTENEIIVWQDVNDHEGFDVCADDHCQRYQGITRIISENVREAIKNTRGKFLTYDGEICDARYYKSCGGQTEVFATAWEDVQPGYLKSISDDAEQHPPVRREAEAEKWLSGSPSAYCNTTDQELLKKILPSFDQETPDFYRWRVEYTRKELEEIIRKKSGVDFGELIDLIALERGPSGRIYKLKIAGSKKTMIVGKELAIRRWLSSSHLLSSAFFIKKINAVDGSVENFILVGGGWGHGVGLCQIGAAVMAGKGFKAEEILAHYFNGTQIEKLY